MLSEVYISLDFYEKQKLDHPLLSNGLNIKFQRMGDDENINVTLECDGGNSLLEFDIELRELKKAILKLEI